MRALYFAKPLEYRIEIPGEQFVQGQALEGTITLVNRDVSPRKGLVLEVGLAHADFKALKSEGAAALQILERQRLAKKLDLEPGQEHKAEWRFDLGPEFPIRTKEAGPFLLYGGDLDDPAARGQIDLPVALAPALETFIASLENHFAFEARSRKCAEGFTEVKFKPPRSYPTLDELLVFMRMDDKAAQLRFRGRVRGMGRGAGGGVEKRTVEVERDVPTGEFLLESGQPNRALYRSLLEEVLKAYRPAFDGRATS